MKNNIKLVLLYCVVKHVLTEYYKIHTEDFENEVVIKRIKNTIRTKCHMECRNNDECHDVRFVLETQHVGECVLLKATKTVPPPQCNDIQRDQNELDYAGQRCSCPSGFKGKTCETFAGVGSSASVPAASCKAIKKMYPSTISELYWVMLPIAVNVYCDMVTLGGGWLLFGSVKYNESSQHVNYGYEVIGSDDVSGLYKATLGKFLLSSIGLQQLHTIINFTQIQFYCYKPSVGRTIHIATTNDGKGYAVINYLLLKSHERPNSCGSVQVLHDDTSALGHVCSAWKDGKWGLGNTNSRLYYHLAYILLKHHITLTFNRKECDDYASSSPGEWRYFVR